jgi:FlaA1/EpsC-like NDP-sugar epimerase
VGELVRVTVVVLAGSVAGLVLFYVLLAPLGVPGTMTAVGHFPRSFFVLEGLLTLAGMGGARFLVRASMEWKGWRPGDPDRRAKREGAAGGGPVPTLVYGAGDIGATVLRTVAAASDGLGMRVVGLLDDDPRKRNQILRGHKVLGSLDDLPDVARLTGARRLLIAIPSASGDIVRRAVHDATELGLETRTVPSLDELVSGRLGAAAIREVQVEDLLRREPVVIDERALRDLVHGETVLVTGAGGSIGAELARQVYDLDPAALILLDRAEGPLYDIDRELTLLGERDSGTAARGGQDRARLETRLANVASLEVMRRVMAEDRPVMVLHAAAYKHVPMMEHHPADAVYTNVGGTLAALRAALDGGVERFVLVSTDKAVEPTSVMGATKRLAEIAVAAAARQSERRYVSVRFGNVLGSSGSVVPLFQRQLREGVPLTITDAEMTRYFMTIPEASRLILQASLFGDAGDLFVLDMGDPVRIVELARDLARLAGRDPDSVPFRYIGLRPGEKLHESLFYDVEAIEPTAHPKVLRVRRPDARDLAPAEVFEALDALVAVGVTGDHAASRSALDQTLARLDPVPAPAHA